jgi:hypothetical protein
MRCPISMNVPDTDRQLCARSAVDTRFVDVPASRVDLVTVFLGMTAHRRFVT